MKQFEDAIRRHLEELAERDELFRAVFSKEGKSIAECCRYILSEARKRGVAVAMSDEENNPVETIEVSLKTFEIVQSRGRSNQPSPRHAEIVDIVKNNMNLIKERATL